MSGSLFDYTQNDPLMGGSGPAGVPGAGTPPTTLATMWDWLRRQRSPLTGLQPGQQVPNGQGLSMNPDGSVGTPGGGFNGPPRPMDPTTAAPPVPAPQSPLAAAMEDPYRNAPSPASMAPSASPGVASQAQIAAAPPPPTPAQAAQSAQDTSGPNYNTDVQQANQPAQKTNPNASPADYSSASPPPDAGMALVVQNAAQKYGVPQEVANWVGFHESNWNPKVGTNSYGATGPWQFKKATADQYGLSDPNDFNASTDAAMRLLADNYKKTGNWTDAVAAYGTFSTGKGADADAAARNGFVNYAQNANLPNMGKGTQVAGPGAGTNGANMAPDQQNQLAALGIDPKSFQLPFDYQAAVQPSTSEKLYRMAAALQGNAGQAAGLMAADRQKMLEANNNALATQRTLGMLGIQNAGLGIRQQVANNGTARVGIAQTNSQTAQQRLALAQDQLNPDVKARLSQATAGGKAASADINTTLSTQAIQADNQASSDIDNSIKLIQQRPDLMGPTLQNRWSRFAAENGLTGEAADLNALQKMTTDQRNQMLTALTNGHVGGIRSNAELQNISKAVADVGTSPAAANFILNMQKQQVQARQAWRDELTARLNDPDQVDSVTGQHLAVTRSQFLNGYNKDHPLPEYESPTAGNAAGTKPGQNADGSTKGAATLRYDQSTGRMVPM